MRACGETEIGVLIYGRIGACYLYLTYSPVFTVGYLLESANERTNECPVPRLQARTGRAEVPEGISGRRVPWCAFRQPSGDCRVAHRGICRVLAGGRRGLEVLEYRREIPIGGGLQGPAFTLLDPVFPKGPMLLPWSFRHGARDARCRSLVGPYKAPGRLGWLLLESGNSVLNRPGKIGTAVIVEDGGPYNVRQIGVGTAGD